jgi:hypothetical protein
VTAASLSVSLDETFDFLTLDSGHLVNVFKLANDVTHRRLKRWVKSGYPILRL